LDGTELDGEGEVGGLDGTFVDVEERVLRVLWRIINNKGE
jgi:hypothetical protein